MRSYLDEATALDWSDAELNRLLNIYYHKVRVNAITAYEDYFVTSTTFSTVADQEEYDNSDGVPTDIFKLRRVELNYDVTTTSGAPTRCLPIFNIDAVRRDLGYENAGIGLKVFGNAYYYTYGYGANTVIGFIPKPDKTGTNAVKIWYIPEVADLSSDSSTIDIPYPDQYWINIVYGAMSEALRFGSQDTDNADKFDAKYERGTLKMQEDLKDKLAEEGKSVMDVLGDSISADMGGPY